MRIIIFASIILVITGCQNKNIDHDLKNSQIIHHLTGRWASDVGGWEIEFTETGQVEEVIHPLGKVVLRPGQTTVFPVKEGGTGFYKTGQCSVSFDEKTRELVVEIIIESFRVEKRGEIIEGSSLDDLSGVLSDDGTTWDAEWFSVPKYYVTVPDEKYSKHELPTGGVEIRQLKFTRILK